MKTWSVYSSVDGLFTGQIISGPVGSLEANIPPTMLAIEGRYDHRCQRVDVEVGVVVDYLPPQPNDDYEWRAENPDAAARASQRWRWVKKPEVIEAERRRAQALARMAQLDQKSIRAAREDRLQPNERDAKDGKLPRERLQEIEDELAQLRTVLSDRP